jgi:predicted metal-dependent HD superfamily phosphohydrolase
VTKLQPPAGLVLPPGLWEVVRSAYGSPGRVYHTLEHLTEMGARFDEVAAAPGWQQPHEIFLALLFHDAVYVAGMPDNEACSAELARQEIARWLPGQPLDLGRIDQLIRLTARHGSLAPGELDAEAALFVDCDMAILGAAPARFDAYDAAVAAEFAGLPPDWYRSGRRRFLLRLLAAPRIFWSDFFHARLDAAARANLDRALARVT